ncbi:MAG: pyridoxal phosphate-dependent aminotransferase [Thermoanaerobaculales bacterium]|jgi:aspartate/methionine/tyrosine aminotransferase|nr:pyridoxal phosphate-dependent aminotransferase [Thermoanaerobaculales bacterium]
MNPPASDLGPIRTHIAETVSATVQRTLDTAPVIPAIAARAKAAAEEHPDFIRGDQGQVVGIRPDLEIYYGPSSGLPELRHAVARFWTRAYGLGAAVGLPEGGLTAENVAVVSGATEGIAILMRLLAPGHRVGVQRWFWGNYRNLIAHAGGEPVVYDLFTDDGRFAVDAIEAAVDERDIRVLIINAPANPTGDTLDDRELAELADLARRRKLVIVADEVYNWIRYDAEPRSFLGFAPERTIVVGAASKEYLIPGARTGYLISSDTTLAGEWLPRMIRCSSSSPNVLGQRTALDMLAPDVEDLEAGRPPRLLLEIRRELERRRDRMAEALQNTGWTLITRDGKAPRGGISMFARLPEGFDDDRAFLDRAMELGLFSAIPGSAFGASGCVRFGYAGMTVEQIGRLEKHLRSLAG